MSEEVAAGAQVPGEVAPAPAQTGGEVVQPWQVSLPGEPSNVPGPQEAVTPDDIANGFAHSQLPKEFIDSLPTDLKKISEKYNHEAAALLRAHKSLEMAFSKKKESYTEADWNTLLSMEERYRNVPSSEDGYELKFQAVDEHSRPMIGEEFAAGLKKAAFLLGASKDQAQGWYNFFNEWASHSTAQGMQDLQAVEVAGSNELKKEWSNDYQDNLDYATRCFDEVLPRMGVDREKIQKEFGIRNITSCPETMKLLCSLGRMLCGATRNGYNGMSAQNAKVEINQLESNPEFRAILADRLHPEHHKVRNTYQQLFQRVGGK
jgi:hypothetical protein